MRVAEAGAADLPDLARLDAWDHLSSEPDEDVVRAFSTQLADWWEEHAGTHRAFLARDDDGAAVGVGWVALLPRVPRPGVPDRVGADVQTVFVLPAHRGRGIGTAVVAAAVAWAEDRGVLHTSVHSSRRAVPVYERAGFVSSSRLLERPAP